MDKKEKCLPKSILRRGRMIKCIVFSISVLLASTANDPVAGIVTFLMSAAILAHIAIRCFIPRKYWGFYLTPATPKPLDQIGGPYNDPTSPSYWARHNHINHIGHWNNDVTNPSYKDRFR
ncbi:MAG: hypothetical protein V3V61_04755 [Gammaproteobacteria bacterium]